MRRRALPLVFVLLAAIGGVAGTLAAGWSPQLGLDLQGGASVVLEPPEGVPSDTLDQAIEIIRSRIDALGVAEPQIARQGDAVLVDLPGVKEQRRALEVVGQTAELRFRPVLQVLPPEAEEPEPTTTTTTATTTPEGEATTTTVEGETTTTTEAPAPVETTDREDADPEAEVVLPLERDGVVTERYRLGPAALRGRAVDTARAQFDGAQWTVLVEFTGRGGDRFNDVAATCFERQPTCPTGQLGIELDGVVQSAPTIQEREFRGEAVISGSFTEREAKDLALVLRFGALPVQLEPQTVQTISATLGRDSLRAGLIAGAVGLALVGVYMLLYYRLLGVVAILSLGVSAALLWTLVSWLSETQGLALTLAGVTGVIVSIGVAVDSNVVYYERLREEVHAGRTLRSAADRGFKRAFSTILRADATSLIGAALLYYFTVGPVRGFAFMLGMATILDVVASWFFMRPMVEYLVRTGRTGTPRMLGVSGHVPTIAPAPAGGGR